MNKTEKQRNLDEMCHLQRLQWDDLRDPMTYQFKNVTYPFGVRRVAVHDNRCEFLQASRSVDFRDEVSSYEAFFEEFKRNFESVKEYDQIRYNELRSLESSGLIKIDRSKSFYEYGFRNASVFNLWKNEMSHVRGCDIVRTCVNVTRDLGFNTERIDLNVEVPELSNVSLLTSYHVLEHLTDPLACIQRTYNGLSEGSIFHVEIPIEPDGPRIRYGHLFPFHPGDLREMLEISGFKVVHYDNRTFPGGPPSERATAVK